MTARKRWPLALLATAGIAVAACGAIPATPGASATAATSGASAPPALLPLPSSPPVAPLIGYNGDGSGRGALLTTAGVQTANLPADFPYDIVSPVGDRLLGLRFAKGHANALFAITATGAASPLETIADPSAFVDAIGSDDSDTWAWMMKGTSNGCSGIAPPATNTDVYISSTPGTGTLLATLPPLRSGLQWMFYQWNAAGIVLTEGGPPGCYTGPRINVDATDLLNTTTGAVTPLDTRQGVGGCVLQDMAADGTGACMPSAILDGSPIAPAPSATVLQIAFANGAHHDVTAGQFLTGCRLDGSIEFGDVALGDGSELVSLTRYCVTAGHAPRQVADTWVIDVETLSTAEVNVAGLDAVAWIPGTATLLADAAPQLTDLTGTYAIAADGAATKLTDLGVSSTSFAHF